MSSNGVETTASVPSESRRLNRRATRPSDSRVSRSVGDGRPREVAGEVLEAVALVGGDAYVDAQAEPPRRQRSDSR